MPRPVDIIEHMRNRLSELEARQKSSLPEIRGLRKALRALGAGAPIQRRAKRKTRRPRASGVAARES